MYHEGTATTTELGGQGPHGEASVGQVHRAKVRTTTANRTTAHTGQGNRRDSRLPRDTAGHGQPLHQTVQQFRHRLATAQ